MKQAKSVVHARRRGAVLVLSLIFIVMFSALAVAMADISGVNVQVAENHRKLDNCRACAESGLEVVRYWMSKISMSGTTEPCYRFSTLASVLQYELADVNNIDPVYSGSTITLSDVPLDSATGASFSAVLTRIDDDNIQLDVTGHFGSLHRTIRTAYVFGTRANTVFDFGVASKGPVSLSGNVELEGLNIEVESNAYIESANDLLALSIIGNSHIAGEVQIGNALAYVDLQGGQAGIGGDTGEAALDHVEFGVPPTEFPEMVTDEFETYALTALDPNLDTSTDSTFENVRIPAGMNPTFSGHSTLKGIIWVEVPNVVTFTGTTDVTGIIVGDGEEDDFSGENVISFQGNVNSWPVDQLPEEEQYDGLHEKIGTFLIAPGFHVSFGGSFEAISGAIAANGIEFFGNAGGSINGSIINYSENDMVLSGNSDLYFNRSGLTEVPAGFVPEIILQYNPSAYSEIVL
ncbi:MAG: hypothetical protein JW741_04520 [Sedimentisphaerales bacterium]|nr:hypothetical protein [Sedimentisphaerales bacterium]